MEENNVNYLDCQFVKNVKMFFTAKVKKARSSSGALKHLLQKND